MSTPDQTCGADQPGGNAPGDDTGSCTDLNRVFVAEDDPVFRHLLKRWFESWNYKVVSAENGTVAWEILKQHDAPHLVILDWMMPGMDGIELCRRIRSERSITYRYVLLLTAKDNKRDIVAGLDAGADDYLTKPFVADELRARVRAGKRILELQDALLNTQQALQFQATHDRLTGVLNRGAILDRLAGELRRRQRNGEPLGVMMLDVDHFKNVNDTYGHLIGDVVLHEIARRLGSMVRSYDWIGRYGGEEFLIIVPGCNSYDLTVLAERLRLAVANQAVETSAGLLPVTISLGLAFVEPGPGEIRHEGLLRLADDALYAAKKNGRDRAAVAATAIAVGSG